MDRKEIRTKLNQVFQDVFDDETLEITEEMCANDIEDWDSLAQMDIITASEGIFGTKFSIDELTKLKNVGDMLDLIERKINQ